MTKKMLRCKLLREIKQVDFVLKELNLFLDTHPDHKEALEKFSKYEDIAKKIGNTVKRGSTALKGMGMYKNEEKNVLMCVASRSEVREIRKIINDIDKNAFIIISNAREVFGEGFKEE